VQKNHADL